jgi:predicted dehydrogenase
MTEPISSAGNRFKVAVIGTGEVARYVHLPAIAQHPSSDLVGICGRNPVKADRLARDFGAARVFTNWKQMVDELSYDLLVAAVPPDLQPELLSYDSSRSRHILLEKPVCTSEQSLSGVWAILQSTQAIREVNLPLRRLPIVCAARDMLNSVSASGPWQIECSHLISRPTQSWYLDPDRSGGGVLACIGPHALDLLSFLVGQPIRQLQVTNLEDTGCPVEESADLMLLFENESTARCHLSWLHSQLDLQIIFRRGAEQIALRLGRFGDFSQLSHNERVVCEGPFWNHLVEHSWLGATVERIAGNHSRTGCLDQHLSHLQLLFPKRRIRSRVHPH